MKKLLFAIAGAAVFSAFAADPSAGANDIDVLGFENFDLTNPNVTGAVINRDDTGVTGTSKWSCSGDDASLVKAYGGDNATAPNITEPDLFASQNGGDNYLALDTNGSELQRTVGATVDAAGTYIDTLVQFTPSESAPTSTDLDGAKLAIWLGVDSEHNTTNLMVQAGIVDGNGTVSSYEYKLNATVAPNTWCRLTVKALRNITGKKSGNSFLNGFQIWLDSVLLEAASDTVIDEGFITGTLLDEDWGWLNIDDPADAAVVALLRSNTLFPSLAGSGETSATLTSVGFKGTGALDDFVVTTEDPFAGPAVIDFTLTLSLGANVTGAVIKTNDVAVVFAEGSAQIPENTVVTIEQPTFATGYELDTFTWGGVSIDPATFPTNFTMEAATTVAFTAKQTPAQEGWADNPATEITPGDTAATAYPTLAGSALATADAQELTTWAKAKGIAFNDIKDDTTGTYVEAFLLNCALAEVEDEKDEFVLEITFDSEGNPKVNLPGGKTYNGTLQLKGKANLDDASWTDINAPSTSYKFYMYELSL